MYCPSTRIDADALRIAAEFLDAPGLCADRRAGGAPLRRVGGTRQGASRRARARRVPARWFERRLPPIASADIRRRRRDDCPAPGVRHRASCLPGDSPCFSPHAAAANSALGPERSTNRLNNARHRSCHSCGRDVLSRRARTLECHGLRLPPCCCVWLRRPAERREEASACWLTGRYVTVSTTRARRSRSPKAERGRR